MNKENLILIDYDAPNNWEFHRAIERITNNRWRVFKAISNENHGSTFQKFIRYAKYFIVPLKIAINHKNYNIVLAWQQFYGLILAFYFRIFNIQNTPEIVVMTFIYNPKKSFVGKIYDKFMRYIVTSKYIKYFIVFSQSEKKQYADYFNIPEDKFVFETLGYEDKTQEVPICTSESFFLAAGRSNRDYKFLLDAWSNREDHLKIICDSLSSKGIPKNIEILDTCHDNDYFSELAKCKAVIVSLENTHISSGLLVIIQAMMYGKPVIVTENDTIKNYVNAGKTGLVIKKNKNDLYAALATLSNEKYYKEISVAERKKYESKFSIYAMGTAIGKLLK